MNKADRRLKVFKLSLKHVHSWLLQGFKMTQTMLSLQENVAFPKEKKPRSQRCESHDPHFAHLALGWLWGSTPGFVFIFMGTIWFEHRTLLCVVDQTVGKILSGFLSEASLASKQHKYREPDSQLSAWGLTPAERLPTDLTLLPAIWLQEGGGQASCQQTPGKIKLASLQASPQNPC